MDISNKKISITIEDGRMHIMVVDYEAKKRLDKKYVLLTNNLDPEKAFGEQIANELKQMVKEIKKLKKTVNK